MYYIDELLNVFETIYHDLIIAKLGIYICSSQDALQYMKSYLTDRRKSFNNSFNNVNYVSCHNYIKLIKLLMNLC